MKKQEDYMIQIKSALEGQRKKLLTVKDSDDVECFDLAMIERIVFSVDDLVDSFEQDNFALEDEELEELRDLQRDIVAEVYQFYHDNFGYERETFDCFTGCEITGADAIDTSDMVSAIAESKFKSGMTQSELYDSVSEELKTRGYDAAKCLDAVSFILE